MKKEKEMGSSQRAVGLKSIQKEKIPKGVLIKRTEPLEGGRRVQLAAKPPNQGISKEDT